MGTRRAGGAAAEETGETQYEKRSHGQETGADDRGIGFDHGPKNYRYVIPSIDVSVGLTAVFTK